jgi:hypothetical protein
MTFPIRLFSDKESDVQPVTMGDEAASIWVYTPGKVNWRQMNWVWEKKGIDELYEFVKQELRKPGGVLVRCVSQGAIFDIRIIVFATAHYTPPENYLSAGFPEPRFETIRSGERIQLPREAGKLIVPVSRRAESRLGQFKDLVEHLPEDDQANVWESFGKFRGRAVLSRQMFALAASVVAVALALGFGLGRAGRRTPEPAVVSRPNSSEWAAKARGTLNLAEHTTNRAEAEGLIRQADADARAALDALEPTAKTAANDLIGVERRIAQLRSSTREPGTDPALKKQLDDLSGLARRAQDDQRAIRKATNTDALSIAAKKCSDALNTARSAMESLSLPPSVSDVLLGKAASIQQTINGISCDTAAEKQTEALRKPVPVPAPAPASAPAQPPPRQGTASADPATAWKGLVNEWKTTDDKPANFAAATAVLVRMDELLKKLNALPPKDQKDKKDELRKMAGEEIKVLLGSMRETLKMLKSVPPPEPAKVAQALADMEGVTKLIKALNEIWDVKPAEHQKVMGDAKDLLQKAMQ